MDLSITILDLTLAQAQGFREMFVTFFPFIILFVVLYLLFMRPEQKRAREHRELIQTLKAGDKITTRSGLHGTIKNVQNQTLTVSIAENVDVTMEKAAVIRRDTSAGNAGSA